MVTHTQPSNYLEYDHCLELGWSDGTSCTEFTNSVLITGYCRLLTYYAGLCHGVTGQCRYGVECSVFCTRDERLRIDPHHINSVSTL